MTVLTRREAVAAMVAAAALPLAAGEVAAQAKPGGFRLATFSADVTPPLGHPLLAGWRDKAKSIGDPLYVRGVVLLGPDRPVVLAAIDWCEIRNDSYDRWRDALAQAAGTDRARVLLASVHQHDAPYTDLGAQKVLDGVGLKGAMFDPAFEKEMIERVAGAVTKSLESAREVTHLGLGSAKVEQIASNRRVELPNVAPNFSRYSFTRDPQIRAAADGDIDPPVRTLSFWKGDEPVAALSVYATHPMSTYGGGVVSADFVGLARSMRDREEPKVFQIYFSGCAGDVTAGKYNDGGAEGRKALAERLRAGMEAAWKGTRKVPLATAEFRNAPFQFVPETGGKLAKESLEKIVADEKLPARERSEAALGLSWLARSAKGQAIDLPVVDFGGAVFALAPAEAFVGFALAANKLRPDALVLTAGYGECAPGYIPTEKTRQEGFVKEHGYCWVAEGSEEVLLKALKQALVPAK